MPRSPSYSPRRGRSPVERPRRDEKTSLLVRNIPKDARAEEVRAAFSTYGSIKDVYLPRDYYTQEPRGFGFVQFFEAEDAYEAQRELDRSIFGGREITVVFAEENRKRPTEMRDRERHFSRGKSSYRDRRSPRRRSRSFSRSPPRRRFSPSPPPRRRHSPSPPPRREYRDRSASPRDGGYKDEREDFGSLNRRRSDSPPPEVYDDDNGRR